MIAHGAAPRSIDKDAGFDVLAVGGATLDIVIALDRLPSHDEKVLGDLVGLLPGGPAGTFACAASRLGLRVASLSNVGDDEYGRLIVDDFDRFGVDTSLVRVLEGEPSNFTVNLIDPTGEKAIVVVPQAPTLYPLDVAEIALRRARLLFTMPADPDEFLELARVAHAHDVPVMIDVEPTVAADRDAFRRILSGCDIVSFNTGGFLAATGEQPTREMARRLLDLGPGTVIVTRGAAGALGVTPSEAGEWPGHRVEVVDSTGAGDVFNAAFARAMLDGKPLRERLRFANAAGALAVTSFGPRGRLPAAQEIDALLDERTNIS